MNTPIPSAPYTPNLLYSYKMNPAPINPIGNSIMQLIQSKFEAAQYERQLRYQQSITPGTLTDPLLNLKIRDYYRTKYERTVFSELAGRAEGAGIGAALGAGLTMGAAAILGTLGVLLSWTPAGGPLIAAGGAVASFAPNAAGIGAGVGAIVSDYTTHHATMALVNDTILQSFKGGIGKGVLKSLSVAGKSMDLIEGGEVIRASIMSLINNEDLIQNILNAYGLNREVGRVEMDFSKIRESMGIDLGGVGNFFSDMLGEIITDPGAIAAIGKGIANKTTKKSLENTIKTSKELSETITKNKKAIKEMARVISENGEPDDFIQIALRYKAKGKSIEELEELYKALHKSAVKQTSHKIYEIFKKVDDFDDALTLGIIKGTNFTFLGFDLINKRLPKLAQKLDLTEKLFGNAAPKILNEETLLKGISKSLRQPFKEKQFNKFLINEIGISEELHTTLKGKHLTSIDDIITGLEKDPNDTVLKELKETILNHNTTKISDLEKEIDDLNKEVDDLKEQLNNKKITKDEFNNRTSEITQQNLKNWNEIIYYENANWFLQKGSSASKINKVFSKIKDFYDMKLLNKDIKLDTLQDAIEELYNLMKKDPDLFAETIKKYNWDRFVDFIKNNMSEAVEKDFDSFYSTTFTKLKDTAAKVDEAYANKLKKEILDELPDSFKLKLDEDSTLEDVLEVQEEYRALGNPTLKQSLELQNLEKQLKEAKQSIANFSKAINMFTKNESLVTNTIFKGTNYTATSKSLAYLNASLKKFFSNILEIDTSELPYEVVEEINDLIDIINNSISNNKIIGQTYNIVRNMKRRIFELKHNRIDEEYMEFYDFDNEELEKAFFDFENNIINNPRLLREIKKLKLSKEEINFVDSLISESYKNIRTAGKKASDVSSKYPKLYTEAFLTRLFRGIKNKTDLYNRFNILKNSFKKTNITDFGVESAVLDLLNENALKLNEEAIQIALKNNFITPEEFNKLNTLNKQLRNYVTSNNWKTLTTDFRNLSEEEINKLLDEFTEKISTVQQLQFINSMTDAKINIEKAKRYLSKKIEGFEEKINGLNKSKKIHEEAEEKIAELEKQLKDLNEHNRNIDLSNINKQIDNLKLERDKKLDELINKYKPAIHKDRFNEAMSKFYESPSDDYNYAFDYINKNTVYDKTLDYNLVHNRIAKGDLSAFNENIKNLEPELQNKFNKFKEEYFNIKKEYDSKITSIQNNKEEFLKSQYKPTTDIENQIKELKGKKIPKGIKAAENKINNLQRKITRSNEQLKIFNESNNGINGLIDNAIVNKNIDPDLIQASIITESLNEVRDVMDKIEEAFEAQDFESVTKYFKLVDFRKAKTKLKAASLYLNNNKLYNKLNDTVLEFLEQVENLGTNSSKLFYNELIELYKEYNKRFLYLEDLDKIISKDFKTLKFDFNIDYIKFNNGKFIYRNRNASNEYNKLVNAIINRKHGTNIIEVLKNYKLEDFDINDPNLEVIKDVLTNDSKYDVLRNIFNTGFIDNDISVGSNINIFVNQPTIKGNKLYDYSKIRAVDKNTVYIYFDTETTGKSCNGLLQLSYRTISFDESGNTIISEPINMYISEKAYIDKKWFIDDDVKEKLGDVEKELFNKKGTYTPEDLVSALRKAYDDQVADGKNVFLVAHNASFDFDIINDKNGYTKHIFDDVPVLDSRALYSAIQGETFLPTAKNMTNAELFTALPNVSFIMTDNEGKILNRIIKEGNNTLEFNKDTGEYFLHKGVINEANLNLTRKALHDAEVDTDISTQVFKYALESKFIESFIDSFEDIANKSRNAINSYLDNHKVITKINNTNTLSTIYKIVTELSDFNRTFGYGKEYGFQLTDKIEEIIKSNKIHDWEKLDNIINTIEKYITNYSLKHDLKQPYNFLDNLRINYLKKQLNILKELSNKSDTVQNPLFDYIINIIKNAEPIIKEGSADTGYHEELLKEFLTEIQRILNDADDDALTKVININYELDKLSNIFDVQEAQDLIDDVLSKYRKQQEAVLNLAGYKDLVYKSVNRNYVNIELLKEYSTNEDMNILKAIILGNEQYISIYKQKYDFFAKVFNTSEIRNNPEIQKLINEFKQLDDSLNWYNEQISIIQDTILDINKDTKVPFLLDALHNMINIAETSKDTRRLNSDLIFYIEQYTKRLGIRNLDRDDIILKLYNLKDNILSKIAENNGGRILLKPDARFSSVLFEQLNSSIIQILKKDGEIPPDARDFINLIDNAKNSIRDILRRAKQTNTEGMLNPIPFKNVQNGIDIVKGLDNVSEEFTDFKLRPSEVPMFNGMYTYRYSQNLKDEQSLKYFCNQFLINNKIKLKDRGPVDPNEIYIATYSESRIGQMFSKIADLFGFKHITKDERKLNNILSDPQADFIKKFAYYKTEFSDMYKYIWDGILNNTIQLPNSINKKEFLDLAYSIDALDLSSYVEDMDGLKNALRAVVVDTFFKYEDVMDIGIPLSPYIRSNKFRSYNLDEAAIRFSDFKKYYINEDGILNINKFRDYLNRHKDLSLVYINQQTGTLDRISFESSDGVLKTVLEDTDNNFSLISSDLYKRISKDTNPNTIGNSKAIIRFRKLDDQGRVISYKDMPYDETDFNIIKMKKEYGESEHMDYIYKDTSFNSVVKALREFLLIPSKVLSLAYSIPFIVQNALTATMQNLREQNIPFNIFSYMKQFYKDFSDYTYYKKIQNNLFSLFGNGDNSDVFFKYVNEKNINWINALSDKYLTDKLKIYRPDIEDDLINAIKELQDTIINDNRIEVLKKLDKYLDSTALRGEVSELYQNIKIKELKNKANSKYKDTDPNRYFINNINPNIDPNTGKPYTSLQDEFNKLSSRDKREWFESRRLSVLREMIRSEKYKKFYGLFNNGPIKWFMDLNEDLEHIVRYNMVNNFIEQGFTDSEALEKVAQSHYIYSDKSVAEQYAEFIVPFISYPIRAAVQMNELASDYSFVKMMYLWNKYAWKKEDEHSQKSDYLTKRRARGDIPMGNKLVQVGNPFTETLTNMSHPFYALNNKMNPVFKPIVDTITGAEHNRITQLPGVGQVNSMYELVTTGNFMTSDYYKYNYNNYYLPRYSNRYVPNVYNKLYTKTGYSRVVLNMSKATPNNLKYKVNAILKRY